MQPLLMPPPLPTVAHTAAAAVAAVAVVVAVILIGSRRDGSERRVLFEAAAIALGLVALVVLTGFAPERWGVRRGYGRPAKEGFSGGQPSGSIAPSSSASPSASPSSSHPSVHPSASGHPSAQRDGALGGTLGGGPRGLAPYPKGLFSTAPSVSVEKHTHEQSRALSGAAVGAGAVAGVIAPRLSTKADNKKKDGSTPPSEDLASLPSGATLYVTCFDARSYAAGSAGKVWKNVAQAGNNSPACAGGGGGGGGDDDRDFHFSTAPSYSNRDGFAMGQNVITGPLSHRLGIDGDRAFTLAVLFQPTGPAPSPGTQGAQGGGEAVVFQLFANTTGNNGFELTLRADHGGAIGASGAHAAASETPSGVVSCELRIRVGGDAPIVADAPVALDTARRYLLVASKDAGVVRVSLVDVDAKAFSRRQLLQGAVAAGAERLHLSNVDMLVNAAANWSANLLAFGVWPSALGDADLGKLYSHYSGALREFDVDYQNLKRATDAARLATSCPFDDPTCGACGGVRDWSAASDDLYTSGGAACHGAIDRFCTSNPTAPRCRCWDAANPEYGRSCVAYRAVFGGRQVDVAANDVQAPTPNPIESVVSSVLSPANLDAVAKLIGAVRGPPAPVPAPAPPPVCRHDDDDDGGQCPRRRRRRRHGRRRGDGTDSDSDSDDGEQKSDRKPGFWANIFG